mmetsp:Transcript_79772/g.143986  ORF Transcript_79772/g.143986 Transcript_79772/m.143986 type:complete len:262 (-) Transcript_79772:265-1050(-)
MGAPPLEGRKPGVPSPSRLRTSSKAGSASQRAWETRVLSLEPRLDRAPAAATMPSGSSSAARLETRPPPWPSNTPNKACVDSGGPSWRSAMAASSMAGRQPLISEDAQDKTSAPFSDIVVLFRSGPSPGPGRSTTAPPAPPAPPSPPALSLPGSVPPSRLRELEPLELGALALEPLARQVPTKPCEWPFPNWLCFSMVRCTRPFPGICKRSHPLEPLRLFSTQPLPAGPAFPLSASSSSHTSSAPRPRPSLYAMKDTLAPA